MQLVLIELGAGLEKQTRLQAAGELSSLSGGMHTAVPQQEGLNEVMPHGPCVHALAPAHARTRALLHSSRPSPCQAGQPAQVQHSRVMLLWLAV